MLFDRDRRSPAQTGERSLCPTCTGALLAKCGALVIPHWAHLTARDCDPWSEPVSAWHHDWQLCVPAAWREVPLGPHRADIRRPDGLVVELQHSPLSVAEIRARERFYRRLVWVFDATHVGDRFDIRDRGTYHTFRWKHSRRRLVAVTARTFLDLGDGALFEVKRFYHDRRTGGWGRRWSREQFLHVVVGAAASGTHHAA